MRYGSVCSGIEAASVAWHPLGWKPAFFSEIDPFPRAVLTHRFPAVPLHGDFTTIEAGHYEPIDLLVGGTPCQSFSVAGLRGGLGDDRGNLALEYLRLAARLRPRWLVWENVPGVLSSGGGRDFSSILGGMVELGYGVAYRVLDAQYVRVDGLERAVPQRRRRVFVVGYLGDWRRAAAVLFERESLSGHPPPRREARKGIAGSIARSVALRGREGGGTAELGGAFPETLRASTGGGDKPHALIDNSGDVGYCLTASAQQSLGADTETLVAVSPIGFSAKDHGADAIEGVSPTLRAGGHTGSHANAGVMPAIAFDARQSDVCVYGDRAAPIDTDGHTQAVAFGLELGNQGSGGNTGWFPADGPSRTLDTSCPPGVAQGWAVRRLTPTECEKLQGFPPGWTNAPYRGKPASDGPRYKALGNSMAVNVMRWIGRRIELVESISE